MPTATATIRINDNGRCTIPADAREKLGIKGDEVYATVEVSVDE